MLCNAESISSSSVRGRPSSIALAVGFGRVLGFGLPRSEVSFPGPFFFCWVGLEVIRRTFDGEGVRECSVDERREWEGDMGTGSCSRGCCVGCFVAGLGGFRRSFSSLRNISTCGNEPRRLRQWRFESSGGSVREYFTASCRYGPSRPGRRVWTCDAVHATRSLFAI